MRNYEFLSIEDRDKINNIKNAINYRVGKHCMGRLTEYELEKICDVVDLNRQYKVVATSSKRFFENLVLCGYSSESDDKDKDLIIRHRVYKILGNLNVGYKRKGVTVYPTRISTNRCVVCVQDFILGSDNGFVRDTRNTLYIYIGKSGCDEV